MKKKSIMKLVKAMWLRTEKREAPGHCLGQGRYCETRYPFLQLLETLMGVVDFVTTSVPVGHGQG